MSRERERKKVTNVKVRERERERKKKPNKINGIVVKHIKRLEIRIWNRNKNIKQQIYLSFLAS